MMRLLSNPVLTYQEGGHMTASAFDSGLQRPVILGKGKSALEILSGREVDLIISDYMISQMEEVEPELKNYAISIHSVLPISCATGKFYEMQGLCSCHEKSVFVLERAGSKVNVSIVNNEGVTKSVLLPEDLTLSIFGYESFLRDQIRRMGDDVEDENAFRKAAWWIEKKLLFTSIREAEILVRGRSQKTYRLRMSRQDLLHLKRREWEPLIGYIKEWMKKNVTQYTNVPILVTGEFAWSPGLKQTLESLLMPQPLCFYRAEDAAPIGGVMMSALKQQGRDRFVKNVPYHHEQDAEENTWTSEVWRLKSRNQYDAFWRLKKGIADREKTVKVRLESEEQVRDVVTAVKNTYPETAVVVAGETCYKDTADHTMCIVIHYHSAEDMVEDRYIFEELESLLRESCKDLSPGCADQEICYALYRHLSKEFSFAQDEYDVYPDDAYSLRCVEERQGVCNGLSHILIYLLRRVLGIPVGLQVGGGAEEACSGEWDHCWNQIQLPDGIVRSIDLAWECSMPEESRTGNLYYLMDDERLVETGHCWDKADYLSALS